MDWKKIGLFCLFLMIGAFIFGAITVFTYISLFLPIFFILYVIFLVLILKAYSKKRMTLISLTVLVYLLIMLIPFPTCNSSGFFSSTTKECTCIGIEKHSWMVLDASWSQCVGIPINYVCHRVEHLLGQQEEIPCD
jgi:hypothetical protein